MLQYCVGILWQKCKTKKKKKTIKIMLDTFTKLTAIIILKLSIFSDVAIIEREPG